MILPYRLNMQSELANWFGDLYPQLHVLFKSNLNSNAAVMVQQGLACALAIEGSLSFWNQNLVKCIGLSPQLSATTAMAWKREQPLSLAVSKFILSIYCFHHRKSNHVFLIMRFSTGRGFMLDSTQRPGRSRIVAAMK